MTKLKTVKMKNEIIFGLIIILEVIINVIRYAIPLLILGFVMCLF